MWCGYVSLFWYFDATHTLEEILSTPPTVVCASSCIRQIVSSFRKENAFRSAPGKKSRRLDVLIIGAAIMVDMNDDHLHSIFIGPGLGNAVLYVGRWEVRSGTFCCGLGLRYSLSLFAQNSVRTVHFSYLPIACPL